MSSLFSLLQLGWRPFYSQQISLTDLELNFPARVVSVERSRLTAFSERGPIEIQTFHGPRAVGDWVLVELDSPRIARVLERETVLARVAAGSQADEQLIAANIDTAFLVSSCNLEFNLSRLERYLTIAREGRIEPVVVLTKADLVNTSDDFVQQVRSIDPVIEIVALDARNPIQARGLLSAWLVPGRTSAFVGSSGVGKSTLINALTDAQTSTGAIREADARGRHTTTSRRMIAVPDGGWIIDTPGMRELNVGTAQAGVKAAFNDIERYATQCRFRDCSHEGNAGCAVLAAVERGELPRRRFDNYLKLRRETERVSRSEHERRAQERQFGKLYAAVKSQRQKERKQ